MEEFVCDNKIYETKKFHFLQQTFIVKTIMVESEFLCRDNLFACPQKGHPIKDSDIAKLIPISWTYGSIVWQ